ncbi:MAG: hypothetical protein H6780_03725 [Candidatus Nomurabacteria bacterium]|nr:MAG: hypothetical protein H6780_03725 [Candidatus Nomurabacteria bacterium]
MVAVSAMVGVKDAQAEPQVMHVEVSHYGGGGPNECGKDRECHGARTACGQVFNMYGISVAHKSLPCGTEVQFCYGSRCVVAKVTDRGPYVEGRSFDLSYGAARKLGIVEDGVARVMARIIN